MELPKRRLFMNAFFMSWFSYYPLVWMRHRRIKSNIINCLHERCLRIICNDKIQHLRNYQKKGNSVTKHKQHLRFFATEMLKIMKGVTSFMLNELFNSNERDNYILRNSSYLSLPITKTVFSRLEALSYLGPKVWEIVPLEIKVVDSLLESENNIRHFEYPCRICKNYIHMVGFI